MQQLNKLNKKGTGQTISFLNCYFAPDGIPSADLLHTLEVFVPTNQRSRVIMAHVTIRKTLAIGAAALLQLSPSQHLTSQDDPCMFLQFLYTSLPNLQFDSVEQSLVYDLVEKGPILKWMDCVAQRSEEFPHWYDSLATESQCSILKVLLQDLHLIANAARNKTPFL